MGIKANILGAITLAAVASSAMADVNLATNGGFESGDTTGWELFPTPSSTFGATAASAFSGNFGAELENLTGGSAAIIKQVGIGAGVINSGDEITISFWAKDENGPGGVNFAELFSEAAGGGVTSTQILGGAPLFAGADWTFFSFNVIAGDNVGGGFTLQFTASTGAFDGSTSKLFLDDVSFSVVPAPASAALLGLGGLIATRRRR